MTSTAKLTNLQQELLRLYARQISETDLQNVHALIGQYFGNRLTTMADQAWQEQGWTEQTMHDWLNDENQ
jgi:hypothetical protein